MNINEITMSAEQLVQQRYNLKKELDQCHQNIKLLTDSLHKNEEQITQLLLFIDEQEPSITRKQLIKNLTEA